MCMILYQNVRNGRTYQTLFRAILADLDKQLPSGNCCVFGSNLWRFFSMMWRKSPWAAQNVCKTKHKLPMIPSHDQKGRWLRQPWLNQRQGLRRQQSRPSSAHQPAPKSSGKVQKKTPPAAQAAQAIHKCWQLPKSNHQNPCIFRGGTYPHHARATFCHRQSRKSCRCVLVVPCPRAGDLWCISAFKM